MNHEKKKIKARFIYLAILSLLIIFIILPYSLSYSFIVGLTVVNLCQNNSVTTETNVTVIIDAKSCGDTEIRFVTSSNNTNQSLNTTKSAANPTNETLPKTALNKYITLNVSSALSNSLVYNLLKIFYTQTELDNSNIAESSLVMFYYNETDTSWIELITSLDWVNDIALNTTNQGSYSGYVSANISRFSIYGLAGLLANDAACTSASECSGGFCCSSLCKSSACPTDDDAGGGGGGGGGAITPITPPEPIYEITLFDESIRINIIQDDTMDFFLKILNSGTEKLKLKLELSKLFDMISIEGNRKRYTFEIEPQETKFIKMVFFTTESTEQDIYVTKLTITGENIDVELPIIIEVTSREAALFDVDLEILEDYQKVVAGNKVIGEITLYNLGFIGRVDVEVEYSVNDLDGNGIISEHETIAVGTKAEFTRELILPSYIKKGTYIFYVKATYNGIIATASKTFEVIEVPIERAVPEGFVPLNLVFYLAVALGFLIVILISMNLISSLQHKRKLIAIVEKKKQRMKIVPEKEIPRKIGFRIRILKKLKDRRKRILNKMRAKRIMLEKREAERKKAEKREAERKENERREAESIKLERRMLEEKEVEKREAERKENERREAMRREYDRKEAIRREEKRREAIRREEEKREAKRREIEKKEVEKREIEKREIERREAERQEAVRREEEKREAEKREAERRKPKEIGFRGRILRKIKDRRRMLEKIKAEKLKIEKIKAETREAERQETIRREEKKKEAEKRETEKREIEKREKERQEAKKRKVPLIRRLKIRQYVKKLNIEMPKFGIKKIKQDIEILKKDMKAGIITSETYEDKLNLLRDRMNKKMGHPEVRFEHYFVLKDGRLIKNLEELKHAHKDMDEETFRHHVNKDKNDFAEWAKHVLKDAKLARKLRKAKTKEESYKVLKKYF